MFDFTSVSTLGSQSAASVLPRHVMVQINYTMGVTKLISFGAQPNPVPPALMSGLMLRCDTGGKLLPPQQVTKGDKVQLLKGPFSNYIANVESIEAKQRVWVLIELMGRVTRLSVDPNQLQIVK